MLDREHHVLEVCSLSLSIGAHPVLVNVHVAVNAGEICGLVGPAGAGKTATVFAALGLLRRSGGSVGVFGLDPDRHATAIHKRCGVVPQRTGFYDWMNAAAYLRFFGHLYGHRRKASQIGDRLEQVGLDPNSVQPIAGFSPTMRQQLNLARALIGDPDLLILDEPTVGMAPKERAHVHGLLADLARRGTGILLCASTLDGIEPLCDRVTQIHNGRTVSQQQRHDRPSVPDPLRLRVYMDGPIPFNARQQPHVSLVLETRDWSVVDVETAISPDLALKRLRAAGWPIIGVQGGVGLEHAYASMSETLIP
jgi:ABC-2 type transport system ATP-binding protein